MLRLIHNFKDIVIGVIHSKEQYILNNIGTDAFAWEYNPIMQLAAQKVVREYGIVILKKALETDNEKIVSHLMNIGMPFARKEQNIIISKTTATKCNQLLAN